MKGDPWQAQVCASGHWTSMSHDGLPYFETAEAAAMQLKRSYPDQFREDRLDLAETGETFAAWRLA